MEEDGEDYIWIKEDRTVKREEGKRKVETELLFSMTPESIKFRKNGELRTVPLDSIKKMYYGVEPYPEKVYLILKDDQGIWLPEWASKEFVGLNDAITKHADLVKTKDPKSETDFNKYGRIIGGILLIILLIFVGVVGTLFALTFGILTLIPIGLSLCFLIWLTIAIFKTTKRSEHVWEKVDSSS